MAVKEKILSYEAFLQQADEDVRAEWVDGRVELMSPASRFHQFLARFLTNILQYYVEVNDVGEVIPAPFQMKIDLAIAGREPDILFIAKENLDNLKDNYLEGPADLAIEILSPESRVRDRGTKFYEYEQAGVKEFWLLDPTRQQAEFYQLQDGIYQVVPSLDGIYQSNAIKGLWVNVTWFWQLPLPKTQDVVRAWKLT
ncbi:MAG: Uma2 family endonuclease [Trueperaceae bacterium]